MLLKLLLVFAFVAANSALTEDEIIKLPKGNILFFMPMCPQSAKITFMPVAKRLVDRGHNVTLVTPWKSDVKWPENFREIVTVSGNIAKKMEEFSSNMWDKSNVSYYDIYVQASTFWREKTNYINQALLEPELHKMLFEERDKPDVILTMPASGNEIAYFLAYKFNSTSVIWSPQQNPLSTYDYAIGQPHNPAYIGNIFTTFRHPMHFFQRVGNTLATFAMHTIRDYLYLPDFENVVDTFFPEDSRETRPSLLELERQVGLTIQFGHPLIMDGVRPTSPNYVSIGMMNCRPGAKLPDHLQRFMDESGEDGVIFVSFGSVLKAATMSEDQKNAFMNTFARLKQRVIWKWETETMEGKPDNVLLSKWLPQQDVLAHPKLKLFVSHGGQSSCQESLCHRKPMVIVPVFGDQPANGKEAELKGYGLSLPLKELTSDNLYAKIQEVLTDPKYARRAYEHGSLLMDDMTRPIDRAVWWIEYALRHPGIKHFRAPSHDLAWYEYLLLDVIAFLLLIVATLVYITFALCRFICCRSKKLKTE